MSGFVLLIIEIKHKVCLLKTENILAASYDFHGVRNTRAGAAVVSNATVVSIEGLVVIECVDNLIGGIEGSNMAK